MLHFECSYSADIINTCKWMAERKVFIAAVESDKWNCVAVERWIQNIIELFLTWCSFEVIRKVEISWKKAHHFNENKDNTLNPDLQRQRSNGTLGVRKRKHTKDKLREWNSKINHAIHQHRSWMELYGNWYWTRDCDGWIKKRRLTPRCILSIMYKHTTATRNYRRIVVNSIACAHPMWVEAYKNIYLLIGFCSTVVLVVVFGTCL